MLVGRLVFFAGILVSFGGMAGLFFEFSPLTLPWLSFLGGFVIAQIGTLWCGGVDAVFGDSGRGIPTPKHARPIKQPWDR